MIKNEENVNAYCMHLFTLPDTNKRMSLGELLISWFVGSVGCLVGSLVGG